MGTSLIIGYSTVYSRRRSNKTSKLRVTGLCAGNSPVAGEFPAHMASNAENVSIWWRHHGLPKSHYKFIWQLCRRSQPVWRAYDNFCAMTGWWQIWTLEKPSDLFSSIRFKVVAWWRHQMETFSALLYLCKGNPPGHKCQWGGALFSLICAWTFTVEQTIQALMIWDTIALIVTLL